MKSNQFNEIVIEQLDRVQATLINKGLEYATDTDRLHNFKSAAALQGVTPRDALGGMMVKHTVSVYDMIGGASGAFTKAQWDEKITDHITYLVCLQAVLAEERDQADADALNAGYPSVAAQKATEERNNVELQELRDKLSPSFESNVTFKEIETSPFEPVSVNTQPTETV